MERSLFRNFFSRVFILTLTSAESFLSVMLIFVDEFELVSLTVRHRYFCILSGASEGVGCDQPRLLLIPDRAERALSATRDLQGTGPQD